MSRGRICTDVFTVRLKAVSSVGKSSNRQFVDDPSGYRRDGICRDHSNQRFPENHHVLRLACVPLLMAVIALSLIVLDGGILAALVLLGLRDLIATAQPMRRWSWLAKALPNNAETGGGLMVAVISYPLR